MSVSDEEPYSTIFASLKHPIRRRILRMLSKTPMSFSEMLEVLGVSSSFLTYHLENLGELIGKIDDGKYKLSSFGEAAMATMTKVEDIPTNTFQQSPETKPRKVVGKSVAIALGIICILLIACLGGAMAYYTMTIHNKENEINSANNTINQLNSTIANQNSTISQLNTNVTNLQNQIASANAAIRNLEKIAKLQESTVIVQDYAVAIVPNSSTVVVSNNTVLPSVIAAFNWNGSSSFSQPPSHHVDIDHAGYIVVNVSSLSIVELEYSSNGLNYSNTVNLENNTINIGSTTAGVSAYFPVLPTNTLTILVGNLARNTTPVGNVNITNPINPPTIIDAPVFAIVEFVTITYYY